MEMVSKDLFDSLVERMTSLEMDNDNLLKKNRDLKNQIKELTHPEDSHRFEVSIDIAEAFQNKSAYLLVQKCLKEASSNHGDGSGELKNNKGEVVGYFRTVVYNDGERINVHFK